MVEIDRSRMTSKSSVKQEKRDDQEEIDQLAAKMVEANRVKMSTLTATTAVAPASKGVPGTLLNYFSRNTTAGLASRTPAQPVDQESSKGRFGWTDSPHHLPYIYRHDGVETKFCSVRILELRLAKSFPSVLRPELAGCISIQSHYVTEVECRLLNEINVKHCEWQYGRELFTARDLLVQLSDALELIEFLKTCTEKLQRRSCSADDRCGFFRIGGESVVPYTVVDGVKYVPLFYFEGETGNLDKRAIQITGWDLAYLKLCCKVQGIRNELFSNDSYSAVSVDDIKQQFPAQTELQLFWPSRSLLDASSGNSSGSSSGAQSIGMWIKKPSGNPPPLPVVLPPAASSVIQKNPARVVPHQPPLPPPQVRQPQPPPPPPPPVVTHFQQLYNGWSSIPSYVNSTAQQQSTGSRSGSGSITTGSSSSSSMANHFASLIQQSANNSANSRSQQQHLSAMLSGSGVGGSSTSGLSAHHHLQQVHHPMSQSFSMMQYAQAVLNMQQQQGRSSGPAQPPLPPPAPPPQQQTIGANSALDSLLRANGLDSYRLSALLGQQPQQHLHRSSSTSSSPYSTSQSPLTGIVPGSSPHSRSSTGASPRPGLPVPTSGLSVQHSGPSPLSASSSSSGSNKPPPPPLIPVALNGNNNRQQSLFGSTAPTSSSSSSSRNNGPLNLPTYTTQRAPNRIAPTAPPAVELSAHQQQQQAPFKLQLYTINSQAIPCVNSRMYVYNNLMMALPDMAAYLFPHSGHGICKQVLQDGLGVTLYEANPHQLEVLKAAGDVSTVGSYLAASCADGSVAKVSLVNVRDVVQYMPQITYMMLRAASTGESPAAADLSHSHSASASKRQRVS